METIQLWARNGDAVRQAIELGDLVHLDTASEELTDACLLFAIRSGLWSKWAGGFPDPRQAPEIGKEAVPLALLQEAWHAHPSRAHQPIAFVQGVAHVWEEWHVPLHAWVIRSWTR